MAQPASSQTASAACVSLRTEPSPAVSFANAAARPSPLDRTVVLRGDRGTLLGALEWLERESGVRFTYNPALLPLGRATCLGVGRASVGDVLAALLDGVDVAPIVAGADRIVLAPSRLSATAEALPGLARAAARLERVVVTGTPGGAPERESPHALVVLDRRTLAAQGFRSLSQLLDGAVPGLWAWPQSPGASAVRYGSIRGASSFGVTAPKIYLDGVEVANPLLFSEVDAERLERIEVIRGPQGAALYGADAISGVVNIVTRHEGANGTSPALRVQATAGSSASDFTAGSALVQRHALDAHLGDAARSLTLGVSAVSSGAIAPGARARDLLVTGSGRRVGARGVLTGALRVAASDGVTPLHPTLDSATSAWRGRHPTRPGGPRGPGSAPTAGADTAAQSAREPERTRQYTVGTSYTMQPTERWLHAVVAGVDGYALRGVSSQAMLVQTTTDSALQAARGRADRAMLRASSTARLGAPEVLGLTLTAGAEHASMRTQTNGAAGWLAAAPRAPAPGGGAAPPRSGALASSWWSNSGLLAQGQLALRDQLFVTAGGRVEWLRSPGNLTQVEWLPMLGAAWVVDAGRSTAKLRGAFGRGIRSAPSLARGGAWGAAGATALASLADLSPEVQSGVEAGVDLVADVATSARVAVHVTGFRQRVTGLVQAVAVVSDSADAAPGWSGPGGAGIAYQLQNVGAIRNTGWELNASAAHGALSMTGTFSLVSSRVTRLAGGYRGDLRAGDRMLGVPARTLGARATWTTARGSVGVGVSRASDWVNYDRLALADSVAAAFQSRGHGGERLVGQSLRSFWRHYDGLAHVDAQATIPIRRATSLLLRGDNLLNGQVGEPDNVTVLAGRTVTAGVRLVF